ncbi:MAG: Stp1/IreP family PP2C-type Ser/Thr phosphatase [Sporomusaceae bacterium]|nr:Stp1/IreP family PP2C-type Ser/Thr phosphatase [Sporomusaceae bacterium]
MLAFVKTDIGLVREVNEDHYAFEPPELLVVADGMGGHVAGEIASQLAISTIVEYLRQPFAANKTQQELEKALHLANEKIYERSQQGRQYLGMGTTVTACYILGQKIYWAHVGDSRMYLMQQGLLRQVTEDHSLVGELLRQGSITKAEADVHPQRNILTRAVGTSSKILVDSGCAQWEPSDYLLLCTDGLTGLVSETAIAQMISTESISQNTVDSLVQAALTAGGYDNVTVILAQNEGES